MFDLGQKRSLESFQFLLVELFRTENSALTNTGLFPDTQINIPSLESKQNNSQTILDIIILWNFSAF